MTKNLFHHCAERRFAAVACVALAFVQAVSAEIAVKSGERIAFLGDSITEGGWGNPLGYVRLVMAGLEANGVKAEAVPAGISGHKSDNMLARLERDVISKKPQWMTLSCGVNDVWHGKNGVALDEAALAAGDYGPGGAARGTFKKNIAEIVDKAEAAGIQVVLLTATVIQEKLDNAENAKLAPYNDYLRMLAREKKLRLADLNAMFQERITAENKPTQKVLTSDGVHMAREGDRLMATGVLQALGLDAAQLKTAQDAWAKLEEAAKKAAAAKEAAAKLRSQAFLTVESAGQDYADQGEYANDWGGAQVIALGDDKFRVVIHRGGLPGAGWDQSPKTEVEGRRNGAAILFTNVSNGWTYSIAQGVFTTKTANGDLYEMKEVSRTSPTLGAKPPAGADILFDGTNTDAWRNGQMDDRHFLRCGTKSKALFTNFTLHLEFLLPFKPYGRGQDRGNSGVYFQDRYEVQVLDSFGLKGENNECGGIYTKHKPAVNMCFPPLVWQTYDVEFEAAQFDDAGNKTKNAVMTVKHNGVLIHDKAEVDGTTTASGINTVTPIGGPIQLQDHGNPIYYRNIWAVRR
jgi:lysophospholipase L1-like esterase